MRVDQNGSYVRCESLTLLLFRVLTLKFYFSQSKVPPILSSLALYPCKVLDYSTQNFPSLRGFSSPLGSLMNGVVILHMLRQYEHLNDRFLI